MAQVSGNTNAVRVGPGRLLIAPLGTTEPTNLSTAWDNAWTEVGFTNEGHTVTYEPSFEAVEVAERLIPISYDPSSAEMKVAFEAAEITAVNLKYAFNGGTIDTAGGVTTFEPPEFGSVTRAMLGWEADDGLERLLFRKVIQTGTVEMARKKAPDKALIGVEFLVEDPGGNDLPWKRWSSTAGVETA